jgi:hypothetical protein
MVACPTASALSAGGSSVERLTTAASLVVQANPVSGAPLELMAFKI